MATTEGTAQDLSLLAARYNEEKVKRIRQDGTAQYVELESSDSAYLKRLAEDPWVDHDALNASPPNLKDGDDVKFLILGTGFCGLIFAARFVEAGFSPDDIRLVDTAGGFGGTWYWNRYPGLMCDSESSIYLPLLEETGYMPKHRYSYGDEIRQHAERIAAKYNLTDKGVFRTHMDSFTWDESKGRWVVTMKQDRGPKESPILMTVTAQFLTIANGVLNHPKAPKIDGLESFQGETVHTGRWRYEVSGGSPSDPTLTGLKGKRVGIIGTGATSVQCTTELAKWAEKLYVFQRTPSSIDERGQREIHPEAFAKIASQPGWWTERNANFAHIVGGGQAEENLVNDGWSTIRTYGALVGTPHDPIKPEDVPAYIGKLSAMDAPRMNRIRQRVEDTVTKDHETAEKLKPWYPSWCKRPAFHDDYLPTFNRPNVTLVQTEPHGVGKASPKGLIVDGKEYELDVLVLSTGYRAPADNLGDPSASCNATITGRQGISMSGKWEAEGAGSLHGLTSHGFPNLFLTGPFQAGVSASVTYAFDLMARQAAHIITEATKRYGDNPAAADKLVLEPTKEAEEAWAAEVLAGATLTAALVVCLPSYLNNEGYMPTGMDALKRARGVPYPMGINAYAKRLDEWRSQGGMEGLTVKVAAS